MWPFQFLKHLFREFLKNPAKYSRKKLGRNKKCYCGSGKKYKHCHMDSDKVDEQNQELNRKLANLNRSSEPNWTIGPGPNESIAQRGLANAHELISKNKI